MEELQREPCPWRIMEDCGAAFIMGCLGGGVFHFMKGYRNSPPDDLPNKVVSVTELEEFAVDNGFMGYICISVKHDRNIAEAMMQLVKKMLDYDHESRAMDQQELLESEHISKFGGGVRLSNDQNKAEGGGGSCCFASRAQAQT